MAVYRRLAIFSVLAAMAFFAMRSGVSADQAVVSGNAFQGAQGVLQINEVAGNGNTQGNVVIVLLGGNAVKLDDSTLFQNVSSSSDPGGDHSPGGNSVCASHSAFSQSGGVVQINQTAGSSNHTVNSFQLQL